MAPKSTTLAWPIAGTASALLLSPALDVATGSEAASVLVLLGLIAALWSLTRLSRAEVGLRRGGVRDYAIALLYPAVVMAACAAVARVADVVSLDHAKATRAPWLLFLMFANTWPAALLSEEGFFRGWLWGSLQRAGSKATTILAWTSVAFGLWHLPVAIMELDFALAPRLIPIYVANASLLGFTWGLLRMISGSVVVAAFAHAVWNALAYVFFGYGVKAGVLGIGAFGLYDPERGALGLLLNALAVLVLWRLWRRGRLDTGDGADA